MAVCRRALDAVDRALIEVRLADGGCLRAIARALDRSPGTVSDEVARHGGRTDYRAQAAQAQAASARSRCGRKPRLGPGCALFGQVAALLRLGWSPEQIAGRRARIEDGWNSGPTRRSRTRRSTRRSMPCRAASCGAR